MMWWTCLLAVCVSAAANELNESEWLQVETSQGAVRGRRDHAAKLFAFYNIPYSTAPTGPNKFKAPLPPPVWSEPFDAIDKGVMCPQVFFKPAGQEQCLIANVFVPDTDKKNLPVLVYIHGGAYRTGYGNLLKNKKLIKNKDIILVNFNYRLSIHGFLCLGTEDAPGNAGMKDQVALLRWVQENIAAFGGNPNDVTIAGYSAGSTSVDLLIISKSAAGLFHKAILESGSNLSVFAIQVNPLQNAKEAATRLNFTNVDDIDALEEFYKSLPYETLVSVVLDKYDSTIPFAPCVERDTGDGAFLTESPLSILKRGDYNKVPMLFGFTTMEGLVRIGKFEPWKNKMDEKFSDFLPVDLKFDSDIEKEEVAELVKWKYFGDKPINNDNVLGYVDYFTDILFTYATLRGIQLYIETGHEQIYLYEYSFVDAYSPLVPHTDVHGAEHCAQTIAVSDGKSFQYPNDEFGITEKYKKVKQYMREIWSNFVITGKPVPRDSSLPGWPVVGAYRSPHMSLADSMELRGVLKKEQTRFWDDIYNKYYREPSPPQA